MVPPDEVPPGVAFFLSRHTVGPGGHVSKVLYSATMLRMTTSLALAGTCPGCAPVYNPVSPGTEAMVPPLSR